MLYRVPKRFDGLCGDHRLAATPYRRRNHHRQFLAVLIENFADGDQGRLGIQRVEDCLDQKQIGTAGNKGAHLLSVCGLHLIEGDYPKS